MASTPFFFFLGSVLSLAWFTTDVHSEKVLLGLKGSSVVLSPDDAGTSITSITWKHGDRFVAVWAGEKPTFYFRCNDLCSLNTKTGNLTVNDVKIEDSGEYTPEINGKILSAMKLQVLSPVPKPRITHDCNPEETKCTLTCSFDRTDDLGDVEVFWILDDRREKGTELQITKDTKEETFICSLKNPVSSENSTELKNPLFSGVTSLNYPLIVPIALIEVGLIWIFHVIIRPKILRFFRGRNEQRSSAEEQKGLNDESNTVVWKQTEMNGVTENTREERQNNRPPTIITPPGGSDINGRPRTRDPAEDPLNSSSSSSEDEKEV
ncbi:uncharacterized protein LOC105358837 isoform X2 [Oryzias latipes]|uniref:uncharacterized protein LOC105358837 isoform X2 n=1 Tax=Oryzias latipes TaxID=8090 RepID=UPI0009D97A25|nr:uncharacterized protein LOC105358837 isoform X2 [Oryzias latipes]